MAKQYSAPPSMGIDPEKKYKATFKTEKGDFVIELYADKAPKTVNNFVFLARDGFYDNTTFHRVIKASWRRAAIRPAQAAAAPATSFADEFNSSLKHSSAGILSMANAGPNTNGSQFFITYGPTPHLDGKHAVFGKVTAGMDVVNSIPERDPMRAAAPGIKINTIEIAEE